MSHFLICTMPLAGHVNPGLPIARALVERGHEVHWYTGRRFRATIEATGARFEPMQAAFDPGDGDFFEPLAKLSGFAAMNWGIKHAFIDPIPSQVADLKRILAEFRADVVLSDQVFAGAEAIHELGGPLWATFSVSALTLSSRDTAPFNTTLPPSATWAGRIRNRVLSTLIDRVMLRDATNHVNYVRWTLGLPPLRRSLLDLASPFLYLHGTTAMFEYPRSDLPPQVHFIGPLLPPLSSNWTPPVWWNEVLHADRPIVHVTQGTVATDANELILPTLRALANENVLVIATTGGSPVERIGVQSIPKNAYVELFLPHGHLLPHVDVIITNGGFNGVQSALAHGVPLIVAGTSEEKAEINARVAWSGAGINLKTKSPTTQQIHSAVRSILDDPRYRQNAERIKADYHRHSAPQEAAVLLERLVVTGQPVLRATQGGFVLHSPKMLSSSKQ